MKKFNKSKVIIPALAMIALTTAASATGTVAWFAANGAVSVSGLQVGIKNDNVFLLVSKTATTASAIQTENTTSITETGNTNLAPSHPKASASITNLETAGTVSNWETGTSNNPGLSTPQNGVTFTPLTTFEGFVKKYDYHLTLAAGSADAYSLKVSSYTIKASTGKTIKAVRALFATSTAVQTFSATDTDASDNTVLAASMDDENVVDLSVFVYYDGTDSSVYTNNDELDGASISFSLTVSATNPTPAQGN